MASDSWLSRRKSRGPALRPRTSATLVREANRAEAMGNVPYAAARENELADASLSPSTRLGTDASLAGDHSSVKTSRTKDARNRCHTELTRGNVASTRPRPT